ncbi:acyl-CoA dehydrogenase [Sphingomonas quercus]|uniref:Acyl-CoA dehydrogenase n=1 Tax=Sphingomonas quercus TaxID=2842451 RepID=A0ABS6BP55_9SPHN|nr:acyl-CoA dehydrogenase [Sphingomonas quercus]MBU3079191.1 acyl-CoA dehydrogenase [Sphingomonas quercus]
MPYVAPVAEQRFVLDHIAGLAEIAAHERFAAASPDTVEAILVGAGEFAEGVFAPLNLPGDRAGATLTAEGVVTPPGFREAWRAYVEGGWNSLAAPAEHGGMGLPFVLAAAVQEDLGSANLAFSLCPMLSTGAVEALARHGTAEQQAAWLPKLVTGEWTGTMNLTEPQAGSDVGALRSTATRLPDGRYAISGTKIFITWGEHDLVDNIVHLVLARTPGAAAGTRGISLFIVPRFNADGAANDAYCSALEHKLGIHASPTCVMHYGEQGACIGEIIGGEGEGMRAMFTMMNVARLNVGLQGVSIAERATQAAVDYAQSRIQSARAGAASREPVAIIGHPDVRRMLLRMKALTQGARALVYFAASQVDRAAAGEAGAKARADLLTPLAKAWGTDIGCEVASLGLQVHGGAGYIEETGAAQYFRDARIAPIYEGTNGIQAADLVTRKLGLEEGATLDRLLAEIAAAAAVAPPLAMLAEAVAKDARWLHGASIDDRLAASYPFLTMLAVATAGMLMARQLSAADGEGPFLAMKRAACRFFLDRIVPEAPGLSAQVSAGAAPLYAVDDEAFRA